MSVNGDAPDTVGITVDGKPVTARPGQLVIDACEDAGVYIPRFCYHERMRPVGMCRMCIVEIDGGRGPALQPSCMLTVTPDMVVDTESEVTKKAQDGVLEFLLINHPLDCPVCDKGGECPLQDQTMAYGPGESRFVEEKRHYEKPIAISDTVYLDRERCILCDRCTRFADEVAGDPLISFLDRGNQTQVNTFPGEPFSSYFSGNTVQICPVGALTAKPYRFKARPWDLEEVDSTFPNPMGDQVNVQSSRNELLRYNGVDSDPVNWGWLSDKDRFSFEALRDVQRVDQPLVRGRGLGTPDPTGSEMVETSWATALDIAATAISDALAARGPSSIAVLGGARLTNEDQYAWAKLAKGVIGTDNVDARLGDDVPAEAVLGLPRATIDDACRPGGIIVLMGPDPKENLGTLYLRLRHAVVEDKATLIELTPTATGLTRHAAHRLHVRPGEAGAVVRALVAGPAEETVGGIDAEAISAVAELLRSGAPVTVLWGRTSLAESAAPIASAATAFAEGFPGATFLPLLRRGNLAGALDMGLAPGLLPGRTTLDDAGDWYRRHWPTLPAERGYDAEAIMSAAADGRIETLILLGADPIADFPDRELASRALNGAQRIIALDQFLTGSTLRAHVLLPVAGFPEVSGTHTNIEGRMTAVRQKVTPPGTARSDWMIAAELARRLGHDLELESVASIWAEIEFVSPVHAGLDLADIGATPTGVVVTGPAAVGRPATVGAPSFEPVHVEPTDSYSFRLIADRKLYDNGVVVQHCDSLAALAPGAMVRLNPYDFDRLGEPAGTPVRVIAERATMNLPVAADAAVPRSTAAVAFNQPGGDIGELIVAGDVVTEVRIESAEGHS